MLGPIGERFTATYGRPLKVGDHLPPREDEGKTAKVITVAVDRRPIGGSLWYRFEVVPIPERSSPKKPCASVEEVPK